MPVGGYTQFQPSSGVNPLLAGGAGAAGGIALYSFQQQQQKSLSRANWGLGIGVAIAALALFSSNDLNTNQTTAQNIAQQTCGLTFTSGGATGAEVGALRSQVIALANNQATICYSANLFSFNGAPVGQPTTSTNAAITPVSTTTQSNSNNIVILAVVALVVVLIVIS